MFPPRRRSSIAYWLTLKSCRSPARVIGLAAAISPRRSESTGLTGATRPPGTHPCIEEGFGRHDKAKERTRKRKRPEAKPPRACGLFSRLGLVIPHWGAPQQSPTPFSQATRSLSRGGAPPAAKPAKGAHREPTSIIETQPSQTRPPARGRYKPPRTRTIEPCQRVNWQQQQVRTQPFTGWFNAPIGGRI